MGIKERLANIEFQLLKNLPAVPSDEQMVAMSNSIIRAQLLLAEDNGEDITDTSGNPTTFLSGDIDGTPVGPVTVTWDENNPEGDSYTLEYNGITVTQDADDPIEMIVNPNDGINDAEAVALDKGDLSIGLGGNPDLQNVESNLSFPQTGSNGTTISWDASAHSQIENSGAVTQGGSDVTADVVATISRGSESDTKTFSVTVLQTALSGTEFVTTWQTDATGSYATSNSDQVKLPLDSGGTYNFTVDWGDGTQDTITAYNQAEVTHTYASAGSYDITIDGTCEGWGFAVSGEDNSKLIGIKQWGNVKLHNQGSQFRNCDNITSYTANDVLDVSSVTNMSLMFYFITLPDGFNISGWDTSNVTNMGDMFRDATLPDGFDISGWDTSNVTNMDIMFQSATLPDGFDISTWNTSSVTDMDRMFANATLPDGFDISGWTTSSVTNMSGMLREITLPSGFDISGWDASSVTDMSLMFFRTTLPTGFDISGWDTSSVTDMSYMFNEATLPDPFDLSGWCVTNITSRPTSFGTFNGTTQLEPVWGTCPGSQQWSALGTQERNSGTISLDQNAGIVIDSSNAPYIGYKDNIDGVVISKWGGSSWSDFSIDFEPGTWESKPSLWKAANDDIYLAYYTYDSTSSDYRQSVYMWNGSTWSRVGADRYSGSLFGGRHYSDDIIGDNAGNIYAALHTGAFQDPRIGITRWNGSSWSDIGGSFFSSSNLTETEGEDARLAVDSLNNLYVAFTAFSNPDSDIFLNVAKWDGSSWSWVGSYRPFGGGASAVCFISFDASEDLFVTDGKNIHKWDGSSWTQVYTRPNSSYYIDSMKAGQDGNIYAIERDSNDGAISVIMYNGSTWDAIGSFTSDFAYPRTSSLGFDSSNSIFLTYATFDTQKLIIKQYT